MITLSALRMKCEWCGGTVLLDTAQRIGAVTDGYPVLHMRCERGYWQHHAISELPVEARTYAPEHRRMR